MLAPPSAPRDGDLVLAPSAPPEPPAHLSGRLTPTARELEEPLLIISDEECLPAPPAPRAIVFEISPSLSRIVDNRLIVICLLAFAGPLGLPALWLSRRFSTRSKVLTSVLYFLATVIFPIAVTFYFTELALRPLVEALTPAAP